eukprot:TRINITY_DN14128_c0_g1_i1.p1 TRINITY_DN14128_c0_g1~~TRINITY_DN14128_c0_g1_i1.p1  ORF type:complete len:107 (+),score=1.73 TRINITY_DN14128_c0_g1_i1:622-942(+)
MAFLPSTSSMISLTFLQANDYSVPSFKSAKDYSTTLPLIYSVAILVPVVLVTKVFPNDLAENGTGALKSNHSFLESGSMSLFLAPLLYYFLDFPIAILYVNIIFAL